LKKGEKGERQLKKMNTRTVSHLFMAEGKGGVLGVTNGVWGAGGNKEMKREWSRAQKAGLYGGEPGSVSYHSLQGLPKRVSGGKTKREPLRTHDWKGGGQRKNQKTKINDDET